MQRTARASGRTQRVAATGVRTQALRRPRHGIPQRRARRSPRQGIAFHWQVGARRAADAGVQARQDRCRGAQSASRGRTAPRDRRGRRVDRRTAGGRCAGGPAGRAQRFSGTGHRCDEPAGRDAGAVDQGLDADVAGHGAGAVAHGRARGPGAATAAGVVEPGAAGRAAARLHGAAVAAVGRLRRASGKDHRTDQGQPLRRSDLAAELAGVVHRARLPAQCRVHEPHGRLGAGRPQDQGAGEVRGVAVRRCGRAVELPGAQSQGAEDAAGHQRREPDQGPAEPARRHAEGQDHADRRGRVRGRQERCHHRGRGGVRERADPADPVQAAHRQGVCAAVRAGAAGDQQVLHPRPAAGQLDDPLRAGAGPSGVRGVVEEPA